MTTLSHLQAPVSVPYRHKVSAVARVSAVNLNLDAPLNPYARNSGHDKAQAQSQAARRGRYDAHSAGVGFAAQILVEAGLTGSDPFAGMRGAKAYDLRRATSGNVALVA
jgi:hypothetical protein